uniref:Lysozyme n=1 Tax=Strix occidentalis caurina TaxID=311401 RepID=A0A8D0EM48_STROC
GAGLGCLTVLYCLFTPSKVFSQCNLSHVLQKEGLDDYGGYRLCMAFYESTFNTAAQSIKANGSANYSVFQISSQLWCTDDHSPLDNGYRVACRGTTALLLQSQPKEQRQQPKPSRSTQLHPLVKMKPWGYAGPSLANLMPVAAGSWSDEWLGPAPLFVCAGCG